MQNTNHAKAKFALIITLILIAVIGFYVYFILLPNMFHEAYVDIGSDLLILYTNGLWASALWLGLYALLIYFLVQSFRRKFYKVVMAMCFISVLSVTFTITLGAKHLQTGIHKPLYLFIFILNDNQALHDFKKIDRKNPQGKYLLSKIKSEPLTCRWIDDNGTFTSVSATHSLYGSPLLDTITPYTVEDYLPMFTSIQLSPYKEEPKPYVLIQQSDITLTRNGKTDVIIEALTMDDLEYRQKFRRKTLPSALIHQVRNWLPKGRDDSDINLNCNPKIFL